jgi:hypothetical protein
VGVFRLSVDIYKSSSCEHNTAGIKVSALPRWPERQWLESRFVSRIVISKGLLRAKPAAL